MALTSEGEELFKLAKSLLEHSMQVERIMGDLGENRKILRLGVPPMIGSIMLPKIYKEFAVKNPSVQLEITETGRRELTELLEKDRLDMILSPHSGDLGKEYKAIKIADFEMVYCVNDKNNVENKKTVCAQNLKDKPLVLFNDGFFQTQEIKKWFLNSGVEPQILLQTSQLSTLENMITSSVASGFMLKELIPNNSFVTAISMDNPIYATVSLVWKTKAPVFHSMKAFISFMKNFKL